MNGKSLKEGKRRGDLILTSARERNAEVRERIVLGLYRVQYNSTAQRSQTMKLPKEEQWHDS